MQGHLHPCHISGVFRIPIYIEMGSIGCDKLGSFVLVPQVSEYESMLIVHMCLLSKVLLKESQIEYCVGFICKLMVYVQHRVKVLSPPV